MVLLLLLLHLPLLYWRCWVHQLQHCLKDWVHPEHLAVLPPLAVGWCLPVMFS